jgi:hypothetical protein
MAHACTAVMNGRDIYRFIDIPKELIDRQIFITIAPVDTTCSSLTPTLRKLFTDAPKIKIAQKIRIDSLMDEINDALS